MPRFTFEKALAAEANGLVAGIDEAGRGPWAGPVVAAAVILDPSRRIRGLDDSKALTPAAREELDSQIRDRALAVGVGIAEVDEIDRINILQATFAAMTRALAALPSAPAAALVDGNRAPALPCIVRTLIEGDARAMCVAAASIVAKTARDRIMDRLHTEHDVYGWISNKGYGTPEHGAALTRFGASRHHRRSFAPVRARLQGDLLSGYPQERNESC